MARSVECYERLNKIQEGTYGVVYRARDKASGDIVALKQVKMGKNVDREGFPITALREINVLLALRHRNIVRVREMVVGSHIDKVYMVMDYMEHDLKTLLDEMPTPFSQSEVKCLLRQLLSAVAYMHKNWYIHRDLKTSNLLFSCEGILTVCDFGLARKYGEPLRAYTQTVVTLWYRSPELLLGATTYSTEIDMWSVGCIFMELLTQKPLFTGTTEILQLEQIYKTLGSPTKKSWPTLETLPLANQFRFNHYPKGKLREMLPRHSLTSSSYLSDLGMNLLEGLLTYEPGLRLSASDALKHPYFKEAPTPKPINLMPTFPATNDGKKRKRSPQQTVLGNYGKINLDEF
eukprot:g5057.t1